MSQLRTSSKLTQDFASTFEGFLQFSNEEGINVYLLPTYKAVCRILCAPVTCAMTRSFTMDG